MAAVSVEEVEDTIEVMGVLSDKLRIAPLPLMARSEEGHLAHRIYEVEPSRNDEENNAVSFIHKTTCLRISFPRGFQKQALLTMLNVYRLAFLCAIIYVNVDCAPFPEHIVYPKLLEARGINGTKLLHIKEGLTLSLEKLSVLADSLVFTESNDGVATETIMNGTKLEENLYRDREKMAAVSVEKVEDTIEVMGVLNDKLRIAPLPLMARSKEGHLAHKIYEVEPSRNDEKYDAALPDTLPQQQARTQTRTCSASMKHVPDPFLVEVHVIVDEHHYKEFGRRQDLVTYLALTIALVNMRYEDTSGPNIQFLLTSIQKEEGFARTFNASDIGWPDAERFYAEADETYKHILEKYGRSPADITVAVTGRHKSKIEYQRNFRKVSDLDFELLKQLLPAEQAASVNGDDSICKNCLAMFKRDLQDFVKEQRRLSLSDAAVQEEQAMIEDVKEVISAANDSRLREAGAEVVYCLARGAPKGPNLPRARLNHQDALFPRHGKATHSQTWAGEPAWLGVRGDATLQTPAFTEDWLRKEQRRTLQREWASNCRKAAVASTSTASTASDSFAKEEQIARLESRRREQNQRCKGRRRADATDDDRATEAKRKR
ncbi:uncharacterized protein ISCGN_001889 [Ixodes scapularis]